MYVYFHSFIYSIRIIQLGKYWKADKQGCLIAYQFPSLSSTVSTRFLQFCFHVVEICITFPD